MSIEDQLFKRFKYALCASSDRYSVSTKVYALRAIPDAVSVRFYTEVEISMEAMNRDPKQAFLAALEKGQERINLELEEDKKFVGSL